MPRGSSMTDTNMQKYRELQLIQLDILKYFDDIAKKNNIPYFLAFGTLLGAIRNNGFIPWDLDIDITMMRDDYEKLIKIIKDDDDPNFFISIPGEKRHMSPHALIYCRNTKFENEFHEFNRNRKVHQEVYIDIFPIDKLPKDLKLRKKQANKITKLKRRIFKRSPVYYRSNKLYKFLKKIRSLFYIFPSNEKLHLKIDNEMKKYNSTDSKDLGQLASPYLESLVLKREDYFPPSQYMFEGVSVLIPNNYKKFLELCYGDYLRLPSQEKIESYFKLKIRAVDNRK